MSVHRLSLKGVVLAVTRPVPDTAITRHLSLMFLTKPKHVVSFSVSEFHTDLARRPTGVAPAALPFRVWWPWCESVYTGPQGVGAFCGELAN